MGIGYDGKNWKKAKMGKKNNTANRKAKNGKKNQCFHYNDYDDDDNDEAKKKKK